MAGNGEKDPTSVPAVVGKLVPKEVEEVSGKHRPSPGVPPRPAGALSSAAIPAPPGSQSMKDLWQSVGGSAGKDDDDESDANPRRESSGPVYRLPAKFGRYMLIKRLGVGGMAEAFLAQQDGPLGFQKMSVVKRMLPHLAEEQRFVSMFQREAKVAAMLTHTNVVQIYELGATDGIHFIAMEFVDGAPLHKLARTAWSRGRSVPMEVVCCAIADAALGLSAAHALKDPVTGEHLNVVHRDISPDNLMINKEGVTKILDFGVAKLQGGEKTATGEVKGKIPFLAPEHILGKDLDGRVDIYALGITFYWLVTGKRPFNAPGDLPLMEAIVKDTPKPPIAHNPQIPPFINDYIMQMIDKDPRRRPQSGIEVHEALQDALASRRSVVVPFVHDILSGEMVSEGDPAFQTPGFVPSTPQTEGLRSAWKARATERLELPNNTQPGEMEAGITEATLTQPASVVTMVLPHAKARRLAAALAGALILMAIVAAALIAGTSDPKKPDVPAPPPVAVVTPPVPVEPHEVTPPPTPPAAPDPPPVKEHVAHVERLVDVKAKAPATVKWLGDNGKSVGSGNTTLKLAPGVKTVMAVDGGKRGGRSSVPVVNGVADYGALPHGKIHPRANPFADVYLGTELLGTTPFAPVDVVVGTYNLRFTHNGKDEKRTVEVKKGDTARVVVDFGG